MEAAARRRFLVVTVATVIGVAGTMRLGFWQLDRAAQKVALQRRLDERRVLPPLADRALADTQSGVLAQQDRRVALRGHWLDAHTVWLDNRQMNGIPGFFVVTPFQLDGRPEAVVVQRGWVQRNFEDRTQLPALHTPSGDVELYGLIAPPPARLYQFSASQAGAIRQNLDLASFAEETRLPLLPFSILQTDSAKTSGDGLLRQWPHPTLDVDRHYGYAFQWFSLAALMAGLYVWFQLVAPARRKT